MSSVDQSVVARLAQRLTHLLYTWLHRFWLGKALAADNLSQQSRENSNPMRSDAAKKTCKMCRMEIPAEARKCPHCQHFQNRATMFLYHPAFAVTGACLPLLAMLIVFGMIFDKGKEFEAYKGQIAITETQLAFGETKSAKTVDVIGTIKNTSPIPWKEIQFHVDFLNAEGKRIDVGHQEQYSFYLPANGTSSFKVSLPMEFPETNYVKPVISVSTAKDARTRW